jgi:hypothetical protein
LAKENPSDENFPVDCGEFWKLCIDDDGQGEMCDDLGNTEGDPCATLYQFGNRPPWYGAVDQGLTLLNAKPDWRAFLAVFGEDGDAEQFYLQISADRRHLTGLGHDDSGRVVVNGRLNDCNSLCLSSITASDVRFKENIQPLSSSLEKVMLLKGVSYDWKADEYPKMGFTKNRQIGFIAQDVEKVFPELVQTDNNGYKGIYYGQMVPVLLEAMKEQQKEISELKKEQATIAELTEKIAQLQKALEQK